MLGDALEPELPWDHERMGELLRRLSLGYGDDIAPTQRLLQRVARFPQGAVHLAQPANDRWFAALNAAARGGVFAALMEAVLQDEDVGGHHGGIREDLRLLDAY